MNAIRQRKLLKSAALLAAALGLTMSTTLNAQTPPSDKESPTHYAQYPPSGQPSESTEPAPPMDDPMQNSESPAGSEEQAQQEPQLSEDIQAFKDFVNKEGPETAEEQQVQEDKAEAVSTYIEDGTKLLSEAISSLIPEENQVLTERHTAWEDRLDLLGDPNAEDYSQKARDVLIEGAQLLTALQVEAFPGQSQGISQLMETAQGIDAEADIVDQEEPFKNYLTQASGLVEEMDRASEEQTSALTPSLVPASYPMLAQDDGVPAEEDDGMFDWVPGVGDAQQGESNKPAGELSDFVTRAQNEGITNYSEFVTEGVNTLDDAIAEILPEDNQVLNDEHRRLKDKSDELEDTVADDYTEKVRTAFYDRAMLMTAIQQAEFPDQSAQVQSLREAAESININQGLAEQGDALNTYFATASETLSSMADSEQDATASAEGIEGAPPVNDSFEDPMTEDPMSDDPMAQGEFEDDPMSDDPMAQGEFEDDPLAEDEMAYDDELGRIDEDLTLEEEQAIEDELAMGDPSQSEPEMGAEADQPREGTPGENIGGGPALTPEVQAYVDFVAMTGEIDMSMQPEEVAIEGMRLLDGALSSFIESGQQEIEEDRVELTEAIDELEESRGEEAFTGNLGETLEQSVELFEGVQQNSFPEYLSEVAQIELAADQFDDDTPVEEQTDALLSFFESSRDAIQAMDTQRRGAQAQLIEQGLFF